MINKRLKYCIGVFLLLWFTACGSNDRAPARMPPPT